MFPISNCCYFLPSYGKKFPDMELKLWSLFFSLFLFSVQYGKKFPDMELKLCTLYLAVVIFGPILEKTPWHGTELCSLYLAVVIFRPICEKIPWHGTETMFPLSRCCYFPPNTGKNPLTWNWDYVPFISLLLFSAQCGGEFVFCLKRRRKDRHNTSWPLAVPLPPPPTPPPPPWWTI